MNKADLIEALAPRLGGRTQAALAVESLVDVVLREVADGGSVGITGFGTFERVQRAPRTGRNPRTGEAVPIAGTTGPRFRPASYFKEAVADPSQLPADGLAGVRVGSSADGTGGPARPATVRKAAPAKANAAKATAAKTTAAKSSAAKTAKAAKPAARTTSTTTTTKTAAPATVRKRATPATGAPAAGAPATVRAADATAETGATKQASTPSNGGRVLSGGEEITEQMINAKKAQLAKVKSDEVAKKDKKDKKKKDKGKKSKK